MKAMIFAAGEGRRMRPLTLATPKPLLRVGDCSLLEHLIKKLRRAGVTELVINASYLAEQILNALESLDLDGMSCHVSVEEHLLETGGALKRALPYLGDDPFLLVNSDIWSDIDFKSLVGLSLPDDCLAHLVLVESPEHNHSGDFVFRENNLVRKKQADDDASDCLTFSGVSIIHPELMRLFAGDRDIFPLRDLLYCAMDVSAVTGEYYPGYWLDVGTPDRLELVRQHYEQQYSS